MTSRFILPFADVGSGIKPSSGAKLFFFEINGTTPKDTFSDQLSTPTPNTNPVIADSNGVFGDIYIGGDYKVTLKDENDSLKFSLAEVSEVSTGDFDTNVDADVTIIKKFDTVQEFKDYDFQFPDGKTIRLLDRGADFTKISGTGTANTFSIIASTAVSQSIDLILNDGVASVHAMGTTAAAINFAQDNFGSIDFGGYDYTTTEKVTISNGIKIHSSGARILKNFDGVGLEFTNQSATVDLFGRLDVIGINAFAGTGLIASTSALAHGISIKSSRVRVHGSLWSYNHIGDSVNFDSDAIGNSNKSDFNELRGNSSNGFGIRFTGTSDDTSVWRVGFYAQGNFKSGVSTTSDFMGRNWDGLIYSESNCNDTTSTEVDIQKLRESDLIIYAEASAGPLEVVLGANASNLEITSLRSNLDNDNSTAQNNRWKRGSLAVNPGVSGGPRVGDVGGFKFNRARDGTAGEGVKVPFQGGTSIFGHVVAVNSSTSPFSPYMGLETESLSSFLRIGDQDFRVNSNGDDFINKTSTEFEIGTTNLAYKTKVIMFGNVAIFVRSNSPEGNQAASTGSICLVNGGGAGLGFYKKNTGTGNTGWLAV